MARSDAWKAWERVVARRFGGQRNPLSGLQSGHRTSSDTIRTPRELYIECKLVQGRRDVGQAIFALWEDTTGKAKREGRPVPMVAIRKKGARNGLMVLDFETGARMIDMLLAQPKPHGHYPDRCRFVTSLEAHERHLMSSGEWCAAGNDKPELVAPSMSDYRCCSCNNPMAHAPHELQGGSRCGGHATDRT